MQRLKHLKDFQRHRFGFQYRFAPPRHEEKKAGIESRSFPGPNAVLIIIFIKTLLHKSPPELETKDDYFR